jgi:glycerol-3-phosphate dehydrogenase
VLTFCLNAFADANEDEAIRELRTTPELPLHDVQDIVIIGGGMTGVSAAYHCMQSLRASPPSKPFRCLLLEKGPLSAGATG